MQRLRRRWPAILVILISSCVSFPQHVPPGMTRAEVISRYGKPAVMSATADGERWIYPTGPTGQLAYGVEFDRAGLVVGSEQVLTSRKLAEIVNGEWTKEDVLNHFGPPTMKGPFHGHEIWDYRYREDEVFNSMYRITFDDQDKVMKVENGPDPAYDMGGGAVGQGSGAHGGGGHR